MKGAQVARLPDGRLHLNHGPIDLIIGCDGHAKEDAYAASSTRFQTILEELAEELPALRAENTPVFGPVARRMMRATQPFAPVFITPMAAVAGAVADEMIKVISDTGARRAFVNNGGDIAILLAAGPPFTAAMPHGRITLNHDSPVRGVATSGWRGRSWSLGIADSVTVLACTAALADAAATMIANMVDLPGHPAISRTAARTLSPDSDLGDRLVTTNVGPLSAAETDAAMAPAVTYAETLRQRGLIHAAAISLNQIHRVVGDVTPAPDPALNKETEHA